MDRGTIRTLSSLSANDDQQLFAIRRDISGGVNSRVQAQNISDNQVTVLYNVDISVQGESSKRPGSVQIADDISNNSVVHLHNFIRQGYSDNLLMIESNDIYTNEAEASTWTWITSSTSTANTWGVVQAKQSDIGSPDDIVIVQNGIDNALLLYKPSASAWSITDLNAPGVAVGSGDYYSIPKSTVMTWYGNRVWVLKNDLLYWSDAYDDLYYPDAADIVGDIDSFIGSSDDKLKITVDSESFDDIDISSAISIDNVVTLINASLTGTAASAAKKSSGGYLEILSPTIGLKSNVQIEDGTNIGTLLINNCETIWNEYVNGNVTSSVDYDNYKVGDASVQFDIDSAAASGSLIVTTTASADLSSYSTIDFWIKSSEYLSEGDLQFIASSASACGSPVKTLDIPYVLQDSWKKVSLDLGDASGMTGVISIGLKLVNDEDSFTVRIDDVRATKGDTTEEQTVVDRLFSDDGYDDGTVLRKDAGNAPFDTVTNSFRIPVGNERGLAATRNSGIVVMGSEAIWSINPSVVPSASDKPEPLITEMGVVSKGGWAVVGDDVHFFSQDGHRSLQRTVQDKLQLGGSPYPLSYNLKDEYARINFAYIDRLKMIYWDNKLFISVPTGASSFDTWVYFPALKSYMVIQGWSPRCWAKYKVSDKERLYYGKHGNGVVYRAWHGYTDEGSSVTNGTAINYQEEGREEDLGKPLQEKSGGEIKIRALKTGNYNIGVYASFDKHDYEFLGNLNIAGGVSLPVALPFQLQGSTIAEGIFHIDKYGKWKTIKLKLVHNDTNSSDEIKIYERSIISFLEDYQSE